jgi:hypothetical protein
MIPVFQAIVRKRDNHSRNWSRGRPKKPGSLSKLFYIKALKLATAGLLPAHIWEAPELSIS